MNEFDEMTMMEVFHIECEDLCRKIYQSILALEDKEKFESNLDDISRNIHTIKGSSRTVGLDEIADLAHAMEDQLDRVREQKEVTDSDIDYLLTIADWVKHLAKLSLQEMAYPSHIKTLIQMISQGQSIESPTMLAPENLPTPEKSVKDLDPLDVKKGDESVPVPITENLLFPPDSIQESKIPNVKKEEKETEPIIEKDPQNYGKLEPMDGTQRIPVRYLDSLFNLAGELYVKSTAIETLKDNLSKALNVTNSLNQHCTSLANTLGGGAGSVSKDDTLILKKQIEDVTTKSKDIQQILSPIFQSSDELNTQFQYLTSALKEEVMIARMMPLSRLFEPFNRMVRGLSKNLKKNIKLKIEGEDTRIDRAVIEILKVPLEHLIRNMSDHGIETPDIRKSMGKPEAGTIRITAFQQGDDVIIRLEDDGRGIDIETIRKKVIDQNKLSEEQASKLQKEELLEFIFLPGFTTCEDVGKLSGRGVGMDVVKTEVEKISGHVQVESIAGESVTFTLRLPLSLAITHTLLLESSQQVYAFPTSLVEKYLNVSPKDIQEIGGKHVLNIDDEIVVVIWLNQLMGQDVSNWETNQTYPALLFCMGETRVAIIADKFIGESEIVVKSLDHRLKKVHNITGATVLNDGRVGLVIDIIDVLNAIRESEFSWDSWAADKADLSTNLKQILVVEDSLTIREMQRKLLQKAGYDVTLAVDGLDGINKVRRQSFDLIISDINMPRMDGLKMTKALKNDDKYRHIPIVIVSYKDREEDKMNGLEAGADHYVTKSQFSSDAFLQLIDRLI